MYCLKEGDQSKCAPLADAGGEDEDGSAPNSDARSDGIGIMNTDGAVVEAPPDAQTGEGGGPDGQLDADVAPSCGDGVTTPPEECDLGPGLNTGAYGGCTATCKRAPFCGDGTRNGSEICDNGGTGATDLGACNPECSGYYEKKTIKPTNSMLYSTNLGGPAGADGICQSEYGVGWKALIVGGTRRATLTPFKGDASQDWVIQKYRYYYNQAGQLLWRTDDIPLLGVHAGTREAIYADAFVGGGNYPWTGWASDWTTLPDNDVGGTCGGWTNVTTGLASFAFPDLTFGANEACGGYSFILCAEQ